MTWAALVAGSYLLGSISWSYLIVRWHDSVDVRAVGSRNAGATNVLRVSGTGPALAALALDSGKGAAAVAAAVALSAPDPVSGGVALAVVLGHVFPMFHGFRGGKGVATAFGALAALALLPAALAVLVFLVVTLSMRYVSLGSIAAVTLFAPLAYLCGRMGWSDETSVWEMASSITIAAIIFSRHHENIRRLRRGEELQLGQLRRHKEAR